MITMEVLIMVFESVRKIIMDITSISEDEVLLESHLYNELDIDSLDMSQIILALENQYKIDVDDAVIPDFITVEDIVKNIESKINS